MSEPAIDTIVAPATPFGRGALAIVRIDGPLSASIVESLSGRESPEPRMATFVRLDDLDECVVTRFVAPHSFTGNDLVELTLHGSPVVVERVIAACVARGARMAEPGEFTERAVLNGKIDLVQAESIAELINARTSLQAKLSLANLEGVLSRRVAAVRESLLHVISRLEAALDFSEEGYEFISRDAAREAINRAISETTALADSYRRGRATSTGLSAVILGRPNAGKSTLLNRLVGSERAIVTPIPGTTRDILHETIEIGGLPVTLADTAGLREEGADVVESMGISRAKEAAERADIILYLIDATTRPEPVPYANALVVFTKTDLAPAPPDALGISAATGEGIEALLAKLDGIVRENFAAAEGSLVNERQRQAVAACEDALKTAVESLDAGMDEQVVLVDLYRASTSLALVTGAITRDEVFEEIFAKFCIGK